MGSITKRPKAPPTPKRRVVKPVVPTPVTTVEPESDDPEKTQEEAAAERRNDNLLRSSRGRQGTILTGFRGFLDGIDKADDNQRKTLLGE